MKNTIWIILLLLSGSLSVRAHTLNVDTAAFENQRKRVNTLLEERSRRFGEYDTSLQQKTGIFGLFKAKSDMQKSIDILQQIVINDNNIFIETRRLLDLKDAERERFQKMAQEYDDQVTAYMKTISKLQNENKNLRKDIDALENEEHHSGLLFYLFGFITIGMGYIIYKLYKQSRTFKN